MSAFTMVIRCEPAGRATDPELDVVVEVEVLFEALCVGELERAEEDGAEDGAEDAEVADEEEPGGLWAADVDGGTDPDVLCAAPDFEA
ncbi:hypothetical protein ABIA31_004792 [Catenulispora sp. MAP5-51]|uniref:hypothetical protein n=1 Tax=Catenulispora sp. MAP5-51 TaxID=3156298 RepID=UPI00351541EA